MAKSSAKWTTYCDPSRAGNKGHIIIFLNSGLGIKAVIEEIKKNKGILYDNTVADVCLKLFREKGYQITNGNP